MNKQDILNNNRLIRNETQPKHNTRERVANSLDGLVSLVQDTPNFLLSKAELNIVKDNTSIPGVKKARSGFTNYMNETLNISIDTLKVDLSNYDEFISQGYQPYLVIERYGRITNRDNSIKRYKFKRDMSLSNLGSTVMYANQFITVSPEIHRPNNIPFTSKLTTFDIAPLNYLKGEYCQGTQKDFPVMVGYRGRGNIIKYIAKFHPQNNSFLFNFCIFARQKIPVRFRIGINVNSVEYLSEPKVQLSITGIRKQVDFQYGYSSGTLVPMAPIYDNRVSYSKI